jgi:hypothetical protein
MKRHFATRWVSLAALVLVAAQLSAQQDPGQGRALLYPVHPPHSYPSGLAAPRRVDGATTPHVNFPAPTPTGWVALGPASLSAAGIPIAGRVSGLAADPTDANTFFVAAAGGGVWKTTNGGTSYTSLTDTQSTLSMGSIAVAPSNHLKIYAGTGEANNSGDSNFGLGILVSNDGGTTWTLSTGPSGVFQRVAVGKIAIDPTNANIAYAAVGDVVFNGFCCSNTGIFKTTDGGTTWTNTTTSIDASYSWSDVVVDPNTPTTIYAAHGDIYAQNSTNGVYRSTNSGTTWSLLGGAMNGSSTGRFALAVATSASTLGQHVLYVAIAQNVSTGNGQLLAVQRSDNADAATPTFTTLSSTPNFSSGGQGWYDWVIGVDPSNASNIYAAGSLNYNTNTDHVVRSTDKGVTWTDITTVAGVEPHTDSHAMTFDTSNRLILGSDGGVFRFDPTVPSWTNLNSNLNTIQFTGIGQHPTLASTIVGGSQDNGTELTTGSLNWASVDGGDGGYSQISQTNPSICYSNHPIGSFGTNGFLQGSSDGCKTFHSITPTISNSNRFNFYSPIFVDPTNGNRIFLGGDGIYESTNAGVAWTKHSSPAPSAQIDSIAVLPGGATIYVAAGGYYASTSLIYVSTDDGTTWATRSLPVSGHVQEVDLDPNDATGNTAVAVINRFNGADGTVYRTTNAGVAWTNISGNLPAIPAWSAKIDTDSSHTMYVANEQNVYASPSPYSSWVLASTGLPNGEANHLQLNSSLHTLSVATHGRGAWYLFINASAPAFTSTSSKTFTTGTAGTFTVTASGQPTPTFNEVGSLPTGLTFVDNGNGAATLAGTPAAGTGGVYNLTLNALNAVTPNATQSFNLTVNQVPSFTSSNNTTFVINTAGTFPITTTGYPAATVSATGTLPNGVTFTANLNGTGTLQGTPTQGGTYTLTLGATNGVGTAASQTFTLTVLLTPSITFAVPKKHDFAIPFVVSATSTSNGAISYAYNTGPAALAGSTVTLTGAIGTVQLQANQAATATYTTGIQTASFAVTKGSVILLDSGTGGLSEFDLTGVPFTSAANYTSGQTAPAPGSHIAVDGSANIWVANYATQGISKFSGEGVLLNTTPYPGSSSPGGIAIDGSGNAWVANGNGTIVVLSNNGATTATIADTGLTTPRGVAIDSSGNVWVANQTANTVDEIIGGAAPAAPLAAGTPGGKP